VIRGLGRKARRGGAIALGVLAAAAFAATQARADAKRWTTVAGKSQVSFDASFPLGDFVGRAEDVAGEFWGDPTDLRLGVTGALRVKATALRTGVDGRDRDMWRAISAERYPEIRFTVQRVDPSFPSATDRSDVLLTISGLMQVHGVERAMVFPGRVRFRDDRLWVRGETRLNMRDFGIDPPRRLFLRVADSVLVSFDLLLTAAARD
jgi:polyisoprenoid-binding protein YceI